MTAFAAKDSYWYAIVVIGIFGFVQFLEGNFITPKITSTKVLLNAFVSILSIVLFLMLWGIPVTILALPVAASLKVIFDNSENMKPVVFLIRDAKEKHFNSKAKNRLKTWRSIRR